MAKKKEEATSADRARKATKRNAAVREEEERNRGLETKLDESNKGFAMLQKMGYKAGDSLGKSGSGGLVNPISVEVKNNRSGLGRDALIKEIREQKEARRRSGGKRRKAEHEMTPEEFR